MNKDKLIIKGAREHNLKNISLELPRNKLIVITGLSGSGKSSLAFDTIYAEGQRRYIESLSAYARQFLGQMEKPDVDSIEGLSPAIAIEQKKPSHNPRSTVGTVTEIYDYFRLLFARIGIPYCHKCGKKIERQNSQQIIDQILDFGAGVKIQILSPMVRSRKGEYAKLFEQIKKDGYVRVRVDGKIYDLEEKINLEKTKKHSIEVVIDRLVIGADIKKRLANSVETALKSGDGTVIILKSDKEEILFSEKFACVECGVSMSDLAPRMFSFNSPFGACTECSGLGHKLEIDSEFIRNDVIGQYMRTIECPACNGARLKPEILSIRLGGKNINELTRLSISTCAEYFKELKLTDKEKKIAEQIFKEVTGRLKFLFDVGLSYLTLDRAASTLSGGEAQRIHLATQIGSSLVGVLYILDEPSIGLHQKDNAKLLQTLKKLRDLGNTVIVVEHDEDTMREAASHYLSDA